MTLDPVDWSDVESVRRAFARAGRQLSVIQSKVDRGEPCTPSDLVDIAHWFGIAQGVLSERAHALEQAPSGKPQGHRARVAEFYEQRDRRDRDQCVLDCMSAIPVGMLRHWATDDGRPFTQLVGAAELYRRKLGPDPRTGSAESVVQPPASPEALDPAFVGAFRQEMAREVETMKQEAALLGGATTRMHPSYCPRHGREDCDGCREERDVAARVGARGETS